jgi:hypothetical protein
VLHKRLAHRVRSQPVKDGAKLDQGPVHPVTNHESYSHSVLFAGAHEWRAKVAPLLHGRSHTDPTKKPHEHRNLDPNWHLGRGAELRDGLRGKNV